MINLNESWVDSVLKNIEHPLIFNRPIIDLDVSANKAVSKLVNVLEDIQEKNDATIKKAIIYLLIEITKRMHITTSVGHQKKRRRLIDYRLRQCIDLMKKNLNGQI